MNEITSETVMSLREDNDYYCILWFGIMLLSAYFFNFLFLLDLSSLSVISLYTFLMIFLPLIQLPLLVGYFKPERSKVKPTMLALSVFVTLIIAIIENLSLGTFILVTWATSGVLLVSGSLSIRHSREEATTPGLLDVEKLRYPPEQETSKVSE